ncbi:MAG: GAF domain-containing protein [Anaerolineae bacterium]|nr:GAF domain-containing protein [Anaerolineae bacterium]
MPQRFQPTQTRARWYRPGDWPLSVKFFIGLVLVVSLAAGITNYASGRVLQTQLREGIGTELATLASSEMNYLADILSEQLSILSSIARIHYIQSRVEIANAGYQGDAEAIVVQLAETNAQWLSSTDDSDMVQVVIDPRLNFATFQLQEYVETFPNHVNLLLTDQYGGVVAATHRPFNYYQGEEAWWQAAYNNGAGSFYIGQPQEDRGLGYTLVTMAAPVLSPDNEVIGVVRTSFRMLPIYRAVDRVQLGETGHLILVDQEGTIVADPYLERRGEKVPFSWRTEDLLRGETHWDDLVDSDGTPVLIGHAPITAISRLGAEADTVRAMGWVAIIQQDETEAYAPVARTVRSGILSAAAFALVSAIVGYVVVRRTIIPPITELAETARRMSVGDLLVRAPIHWHDEIGLLSETFNSMAEQLQLSITQLEQRVIERTRDLQQRTTQLEAVSQVAREAAAIRDIDQLLGHITRLISDRFGFYHCGIFLLDDTGEYAVLQAASSEGGQRMLARGHRLRVGKVGFVGYAAGAGETHVAVDVGIDAVYFDNPDLPLTRSEVALPLLVRGRVIGVLDVQSTEEAAFSEDYIAILETLADQVALAIENARLVSETQRALENVSRYRAEETAEGWRRVLSRRAAGVTFYYDKTAVRPIAAGGVIPLLDEHIPTQTMLITQPGDVYVLSTPVHVYGQPIGALSFEAKHPWTADEVALIESAVQQLGLALETARLLDETRQRATREQLVGDVSTRMRQSLDLETVLVTAASEMRRALGLEDLVVRLASPESDDDSDNGRGQ